VRQPGRDAFVPLSEPLEGFVLMPYLCIRAHVTSAMGNAFFTPEAFATAPWRDGSTLVDRATKIQEYRLVYRRACKRHKRDGTYAPDEPEDKTYTVCKWPGRVHPTEGWACLQHQGWRAAERVTKLRLSRPDAEQLVWRVADTKWRQLVSRFTDADDWPTDGQLGLLSFAWAVGTAFRWPRLEEALRQRDFARAAAECTIKGGGTIVERNRKNKLLFLNAAVVQRTALDPAELYYPRVLSDETPTLPSLADAVEDDDPTKAEPLGQASLGDRRRMMADAIVDAVVEDLRRRNSGD